MKTRFFYGVFTGFFLACLFFFGLVGAKGQESGWNYATRSHLSVYTGYYGIGAYTGPGGNYYLNTGDGGGGRRTYTPYDGGPTRLHGGGIGSGSSGLGGGYGYTI